MGVSWQAEGLGEGTVESLGEIKHSLFKKLLPYSLVGDDILPFALAERFIKFSGTYELLYFDFR